MNAHKLLSAGAATLMKAIANHEDAIEQAGVMGQDFPSLSKIIQHVGYLALSSKPRS
mgnify:CR=1 FL=1